MREILFRGKCVETGAWYEGQYIHLHKTTYCFAGSEQHDAENEVHQIVFEQMTDWNLPNRHLRVDVLPETVGQYTGLTDKNSKKIFEGDIVKHHVQGDILVNLGVVNWDEENARWAYKLNTMNPCFALYNPNAFEVIGNIHDNPELIDEK